MQVKLTICVRAAACFPQISLILESLVGWGEGAIGSRTSSSVTAGDGTSLQMEIYDAPQFDCVEE